MKSLPQVVAPETMRKMGEFARRNADMTAFGSLLDLQRKRGSDLQQMSGELKGLLSELKAAVEKLGVAGKAEASGVSAVSVFSYDSTVLSDMSTGAVAAGLVDANGGLAAIGDTFAGDSKEVTLDDLDTDATHSASVVLEAVQSLLTVVISADKALDGLLRALRSGSQSVSESFNLFQRSVSMLGNMLALLREVSVPESPSEDTHMAHSERIGLMRRVHAIVADTVASEDMRSRIGAPLQSFFDDEDNEEDDATL
jgi:hypothetical protein